MPENTTQTSSGLKKRKLSRAVVHEVSNVKWPANKRFHLVVKSASAPIATEKADQTVVDATVGSDEDPNMGFAPGDASLLRAIGRALNGLSDDVTIDDILGVARAVGVKGTTEESEDEEEGEEDMEDEAGVMPDAGAAMFKAREPGDDEEEDDVAEKAGKKVFAVEDDEETQEDADTEDEEDDADEKADGKKSNLAKPFEKLKPGKGMKAKEVEKAAEILPGFESALEKAESHGWVASEAPSTSTATKEHTMPKEPEAQTYEALEKSMRLEFNEKLEAITKAAKERVSALEAQVAQEQATRILKSTHDEVVNDLQNLTCEPMAMAECLKSIRETEATKPHSDMLLQVLKAANAQLGAGFGKASGSVTKSIGHSGTSEGMTAASQLDALIQKSAGDLKGLTAAQAYKHVVTKTAEGRALAERLAQEKVTN